MPLIYLLSSCQLRVALARAGQHARPSHKRCKACAKHVNAPLPRKHTRLHGLHPVEISNQPVPVQLNNKLKQQVMAVKPQERKLGQGNTRAHRTNTAKRAPKTRVHRDHVLVHVCTISIEWDFQTNRCRSSWTTSWNNRYGRWKMEVVCVLM